VFRLLGVPLLVLLLALGLTTLPALPLLAAGNVSLPPAFEDRLLYYHGFERADGAAEFCADGVTPSRPIPAIEKGFRGRAGLTGDGKAFELKSEHLSPHLPLTVSFWWALPKDHTLDGAFGLLHLGGGKGFVSHFTRGRGEWCALERPAAILQVYSIPGIRNVNGIYDRDWLARMDLRAWVWHHTALVFQGASLVEVYTDGEKAWQVRTRGRSFRADDGFRSLALGSRHGTPVAVDEVIVLRRALTAGEIADYVSALRQMRAVAYPVR
jgi:hypothetical protein